MKNITLILTLCLTMVTALSAQNKQKAKSIDQHSNGIEVLYFHGKQRCVTCKAIEQLTNQVLNQYFSKELKNGKIKMKVIDISLNENKDLVQKYEVAWSSLFVNQWNKGKEKSLNLTDLGFTYAKNQPDVFKEKFKAQIEQLLK